MLSCSWVNSDIVNDSLGSREDGEEERGELMTSEQLILKLTS